jgi:hypothetical protein
MFGGFGPKSGVSVGEGLVDRVVADYYDSNWTFENMKGG